MEKYSEFEYKKVLSLLQNLSREIENKIEWIVENKNPEDDHVNVALGIHQFTEEDTSTLFNFEIKSFDENLYKIDLSKLTNANYLKNEMPILRADFVNQDARVIFSFEMRQSVCRSITWFDIEKQNDTVPKLLLSAGMRDSCWENVIADFMQKVSVAFNEDPDLSYENSKD